MTQVENAPAAESKPTEQAVTPAAEGQKPESQPEGSKPEGKPEGGKPEAKESTVAEALGNVAPEGNPEGQKPKDPPADAPRMVPEAVVIELKKDLKALQKQIAQGNTAADEVDDALKAIGEEHNVDPNFLNKVAKAIRSKTEAEFNEKLEKALEPFKAQSRESQEAKFDTVFGEHFDKTLEAMPEYKEVANKEVIKALVRDPKNANKTFAQIFEMAYGHLTTGKRTLDGSKPGSGKDNAEIDYDRAQKDSEYYAQIMASPILKAKYNEGLEKRLQL